MRGVLAFVRQPGMPVVCQGRCLDETWGSHDKTLARDDLNENQLPSFTLLHPDSSRKVMFRFSVRLSDVSSCLSPYRLNITFLFVLSYRLMLFCFVCVVSYCAALQSRLVIGKDVVIGFIDGNCCLVHVLHIALFCNPAFIGNTAFVTHRADLHFLHTLHIQLNLISNSFMWQLVLLFFVIISNCWGSTAHY